MRAGVSSLPQCLTVCPAFSSPFRFHPYPCLRSCGPLRRFSPRRTIEKNRKQQPGRSVICCLPTIINQIYCWTFLVGSSAALNIYRLCYFCRLSFIFTLFPLTTTTTITTNNNNSCIIMGSVQSDSSNSNLRDYIEKENQSHQVVVWAKSYCGYCHETIRLFQSIPNIDFKYINIDTGGLDGAGIQAELVRMTGQRTVPNVFIQNQHVGGNDVVQRMNRNGQLAGALAARKA